MYAIANVVYGINILPENAKVYSDVDGENSYTLFYKKN